MSKRLEDLLKKREQLNAEIQKVRARQTTQERKEDTRRKILLGALVREMMAKGELDEGVIMKRLEGFLTRDIDRKLFDLTVKGDDKGEGNTTGESGQKKTTSSKTTTSSKKENKGSIEPQESGDKLDNFQNQQTKQPQENEEDLEVKEVQTNQDNQVSLEAKERETKQENEINLEVKDSKETFPEVDNSEVEIILAEKPRNNQQKISILKAVRQVTKIGLSEGKELVESAPSLVMTTTKQEALLIKKQLEDAGATVTLKPVSSEE